MPTPSFRIHTPKGERLVGPGQPCFIVAEMSANHRQQYAKAEAIIRAVAAAGADAIKLQTYTPDTITLDCDNEYFQVRGAKDNPPAWRGKTLYQLYQEAYTPWEWQPKLKQLAEELGLVFFSMSVDSTGVDFLESLGVDLYKVGSYELTNLPLLQRLGQTGKPVIMSVGYGSEAEIRAALETLRAAGGKDIALLHCVTAYQGQTRPADMHLANIHDLRERFGVVSGFSENAGGVEGAVAAVAAGASIIEKHVIMDKADGGPDAAFSIDRAEFDRLVKEIRRRETMIDSVFYGPVNEQERANRDWARPSIFVVADIKKEEILTPRNIRCIRPAYGLPPRYYHQVLGRKANADIARGTPLDWQLIAPE